MSESFSQQVSKSVIQTRGVQYLSFITACTFAGLITDKDEL